MHSVKKFLDEKYKHYNHLDFIENDPISIPHQFSKQQDIEIAGFFAAMLAWGQRVTIINKSNELMERMDNAPHDFMLHHSDLDLKKMLGFKHRTFNETDLLYFIAFFNSFYKEHYSLEDAFVPKKTYNETTIEQALIRFHNLFFGLEFAPDRTRKHISTPTRKSACKKLAMYLRWMVRKDDSGVDFGLWTKIKPHQLIIPCDVHVLRVARSLGLIEREQNDWQTALQLTEKLKRFDAKDPVKYDFALFGMGVEEKLF